MKTKEGIDEIKLRISFVVQSLMEADYDDDRHPVVRRAILDLVDIVAEDDDE